MVDNCYNQGSWSPCLSAEHQREARSVAKRSFKSIAESQGERVVTPAPQLYDYRGFWGILVPDRMSSRRAERQHNCDYEDS